jgi:hypothetical protein
MAPLTLDDLVPLDEYAGNRRDYFASHQRYLDRYRRVRVGPDVTLVFENRQTLWFRVQEILRIARLSDPRCVQQELDLFNRLLPGYRQLQAALVIDFREGSRLSQQLSPWNELTDQHIRFCLGKSAYAGKVLTCRPEDRCMGAAHWIQFAFDGAGWQQLSDLQQPAVIEILLPTYHHQSAMLNEDVRQSLLEDLKPLAA